MKGFVYKWTNNINGKWYIGSHKGIPCDGYTAGGKLIKQAFKKYGMDNFTRYIIHEGDDYRLVEELSLISHDAANDPTSYNLKNDSIGAHRFSSEVLQRMSDAQKGKVMSEETKRRISEAKKGKPAHNKGISMSEEQKILISKSNKGKKPSTETKIKMSESHKGKKMSDEAKINMSNAQKGRTITAEHRRKISESNKEFHLKHKNI